MIALSFFNMSGAAGKLPALAVGSLGVELSEASTSEVSAASGRVRGFESDIMFEEARSGYGGLPEEEFNQYAYPTTPDDALVSDFAPLEIDGNQFSRDQIVYYVVEDGDTVSEISTRFGIEPSTLLWANSLASADYIKAGQRLEILPLDGLKYEVKKGDTISALATRFKADKEEIIAYNHLPADGSLRPGDALLVPNGTMPQAPRPVRPTVIAGAKPQTQARVDTNKYFIFPATGRRSQGLHGYNGVDLANECGTPIYAAADGEVSSLKVTNSRARAGGAVYDGYGNHIKVTHPNGVVTLYAHLKDIYVFDGQNVRQGSMIATMGGGFEMVNGRLVRMQGAGRSTGCHLHFEVRGARNPLVGGR